jgi:hypothetical protein
MTTEQRFQTNAEPRPKDPYQDAFPAARRHPAKWMPIEVQSAQSRSRPRLLGMLRIAFAHEGRIINQSSKYLYPPVRPIH